MDPFGLTIESDAPSRCPSFLRGFLGVRLPVLLAALLVALLTAGFEPQQISHAENRQPSEYEVKAAFLLNFTKFVEWPAAGQGGSDQFHLCVAGDDPFGPVLDQMVEGERVGGHRITVLRVREISKTCQLIYLSKTIKDPIPFLAGAPPGCLTVGETPEFLKGGGMIAFAIDNRRVRFDVNLRAVLRGALQISSKLLNVARAVEK